MNTSTPPPIPLAEQAVYDALLKMGRSVSYATLLQNNPHLSQQNTAQHLKRLERKGLVAVNRSQGRRYYMYTAIRKAS